MGELFDAGWAIVTHLLFNPLGGWATYLTTNNNPSFHSMLTQQRRLIVRPHNAIDLAVTFLVWQVGKNSRSGLR